MLESGFASAASSASNLSDSVRNILPGAGEEVTSSDKSCFPSLPYETRIKGFLGCFVAGFVLSFLSSFMLWTNNTTGFAVLYTFGNVTSLLGTGFLIGPMRQCQNMWKPIRAVASGVFLSALLLTVICAFALPKPAPAVLVLIVIQFCAGVWYSASYIPYGRKLIISCCNNAFGAEL